MEEKYFTKYSKDRDSRRPARGNYSLANKNYGYSSKADLDAKTRKVLNNCKDIILRENIIHDKK